MGILTRFADIMKANLNAILEKAETENAELLLEQYIRDAVANLEAVKNETASVIADEMAAGRKVAALVEEIAGLAKYAEQAVMAGNDEDAKQFLEGKAAAEARKADAEKAFAQAQENSDRMRELTKKLNADIKEAKEKLEELKGKLEVAKEQEKLNDISEKIGAMSTPDSEYERLADAVQKRIDEIDAKAEVAATIAENADINALKEKYETPEEKAASASIDAELAALKAKLGK